MTGAARDRGAASQRAAVFLAGATLIALIMFGYSKLVWGSFSQFLSAIDVWNEPFADFQRFYYPMGRAVLAGAPPVDGFVYAPPIALILAPFSLLGPETAVVAWGMLLVAGIVVYIWLFRRLLPAGLPVQWLFVALLLSSFPLLHTIKFGQITLFSTVALLAALAFVQRGQSQAGATSLVLAACFKWHPAVFLAPFAARRDFRFLLWTAIAAAILLLFAPVLLLGFTRTAEFYRALWLSYMNFDWVLSNYNTQYFPNVALRAVDAAGIHLQPSTAAWMLSVLRGLAWLAVVANLALVYQIQRRRLPRADLWSFQVLFLNIPFLLGTSWPVDLVFLPFAQTVLAWALLDANGLPSGGGEAPAPEAHSPGWRALGPRRAMPAALLACSSILFSNVVLFNLIGDRIVYGSLGFVFWADALCLIATYIVLLPAVRRGAADPDAGQQYPES